MAHQKESKVFFCTENRFSLSASMHFGGSSQDVADFHGVQPPSGCVPASGAAQKHGAAWCSSSVTSGG